MSENQDQVSTTPKKSITCRYFAASGTCFYGEECQFLHTNVKASRNSHYGVLSNSSAVAGSYFGDERVNENYFKANISDDGRDDFKERTSSLYPSFEESTLNNVFSSFNDTTPGQPYYFTSKDQTPSQTVVHSMEDAKLNLRSEKPTLSTNLSRIQPEARGFPFSEISNAFSKMSVESFNGLKSPSYFISEDIRSNLLLRNTLSISTVDPTLYPGLPQEVDHYHELVPLEPYSLGRAVKSKSYGLITSTYKATHTKTGLHYCLKRIHGYKLSSPRCMAVVDLWKRLKNCYLASLCEVFTSKAFGDNSIVFAYDFFPGAENMYEKYLSNNVPSTDRHGSEQSSSRIYASQKLSPLHTSDRVVVAESTLWSYIIQICSALRAVHAAGLAFRGLDASKILITSGGRLRLCGGGILDVLGFDSNIANNSSVTTHFQQEDLLSFGKLVLSLACNAVITVQRENLTSSIDFISKNYSSDFRNLIIYLLTSSPASRVKNIQEIMPIIGARFFGQLESIVQYTDTLEDQLSRELDNGRLFRLLGKLGSVVDRPELNMDSNWSETGDRYLLKLFQDYILHPCSDDGRPWVDLAHIVSCLNRLDAASHDKICLTSRDHQNVLVVSYAELHQCLESSFAELQHAAMNTAPTMNALPDSTAQ